MKSMNKDIQNEYQEVHEIYEGLNLRQMEHLLFLMSDRIDIPYIDKDGVVNSYKVDSCNINGIHIQLNTDAFAKHCEELDKSK